MLGVFARGTFLQASCPRVPGTGSFRKKEKKLFFLRKRLTVTDRFYQGPWPVGTPFRRKRQPALEPQPKSRL